MKTKTVKSVWKLILILATIGLLAAGCSPNTQGSVNVASDTCKTVITTNEGSWDALTNSFTCSGTAGQEYCARVDLDSNGNCIEYESYTEGDTASAQPTATPTPIQQIPIDQVQITDLKLSQPSTAGLGFINTDNLDYTLKGEVTNNSTYTINNIDLTIEAYDCPGSTITADCAHIGEATNVGLFVDGTILGQIPPNQTREVTDSIVNLDGMPAVKGNFLWSYTVTSIN